MSPLLISLPERAKRILTHLLQAEGPMSTTEVGARLGLSYAQVRYGFRYIEAWLHERGLHLQKTPRVGVSIEAEAATRRKLLDEIREWEAGQLLLTKDERIRLLVLHLLLAHTPLSVGRLRRQLGISRSSLFRDLAEARKWLKERRLCVQTRRGRGVLAQEPERCWRDVVVELLSTNLDEGTLIAHCVLPPSDVTAQAVERPPFVREACDFLRTLDLAQAERVVVALETMLGGMLVDEAHMRLVLHLGLVLHRVRMGRCVGEDALGSLSAARARESQVAAAIAPRLEEILGQALPRSELASLSDKISEAMAQGLLVGDRSVALQDETASRAWELAARMAKEAGKYLHARLFHDEELVNCLALELLRGGAPSLPGAPAAERHGRKAQMPINPLYGFTQRVLCPIMESYGYLPSERLMSSVAGHLETALEKLGRTCARRKVWVICGAGVATARNLITRLNLHLPQLEIMGLASALELARDRAMVSGADAIISTIPLDWVTAVPVLRVSPLLAAEDVAMLKAALVLHPPGPAADSSTSPVGGTSLVELLSPRMIERDVVAGDWEEVVDRAGSLLLSAGAVWPSYVEAMKDMIHLYGPYVVVAPGAALLHAGPEMGGKRLAMSLVILRHAVPFGHEVHDPVQIALAFSSIDHSTHVRAVMEAMALLSRPDALRSIREAATREEVLRAIQEMVTVGGVSLAG